MNREMLIKALQYKYPQEFVSRQIEIGFEPAFKQVKNEQTGKFENIPTGIPENSPNHARIEVWPTHLPKPTIGDIEQWAAAYDAGASERGALETAKQQRKQSDMALLDAFDESKNYTVAELKAVVAALVRAQKERSWTS